MLSQTRPILGIALTLGLMLGGSPPPPPQQVGAEGNWVRTDTSSGERVDIQQTIERSTGGNRTPRNPQNSSSPVVHVDATPREQLPTPILEKLCVEWTSHDECIRIRPPEADPTAPPAVVSPTITITDLASFSPAPGTLAGEPDNLGVAGLPTNFTTDAAAHTRSGTLFGYPVTARFTPASFVFRYGDGQTRTATTAGKTWEALRVPQFTPTETSHTYAERGTYQASVDTVYTAEIDLGTGYFPISGTLTIPGPPQSIQIYEARTALVAHTCNEDPTAEGCPGH
jgi:hypothetical protein